MSLYLCVMDSEDEDMLEPQIGLYEADDTCGAKQAMAEAYSQSWSAYLAHYTNSQSWPSMPEDQKDKFISERESEWRSMINRRLELVSAQPVGGTPLTMFSLSRKIR